MTNTKVTEEKKVMKNIIFVEKGKVNYEVDSLFEKSINTISLEEFVKKVFSVVEKHPDLDLNKVVFVEYEDTNELTESILNKDLEIMKLYLDNIVIVSDSDIQDKIAKKVKIIKSECLQKHLDSIFDVYNSVVVLSCDIVKEINKELKNILTEGLNREEPYASVEDLTYLQELRYYIDNIDYVNISDYPFEPIDIIITYLIKSILKDESSETIAKNIINHSFEFGDGIWGDINDSLRYDIKEITKK